MERYAAISVAIAPSRVNRAETYVHTEQSESEAKVL